LLSSDIKIIPYTLSLFSLTLTLKGKQR